MIQHDDTGKKQYEINKNVYKSDIAVLITGTTTTRKDHVINIIPPPPIFIAFRRKCTRIFVEGKLQQ